MLAKGDEARELLAVVRAGEQFHRDPCPVGKAVREPAGVRELQLAQGRGKGEGRRDEQRQTPRHAVRKIVLRQLIFTLVRPAPRSRDEFGEIAVAGAVGGEEDDSRIGRREEGGGRFIFPLPFSPFPPPMQREFRSDDEPESAFLRRSVCAHDPRERALVGDGERLVAERLGALHQLFRMRGAAQEREIGAAVQLGVGRHHVMRIRRGGTIHWFRFFP